jgi:hypothetical protein
LEKFYSGKIIDFRNGKPSDGRRWKNWSGREEESLKKSRGEFKKLLRR